MHSIHARIAIVGIASTGIFPVLAPAQQLIHLLERSEPSFGFSVESTGDANGDGVLDIVVGAHSTKTGKAFLYSGKDGTLLQSFTGPVDGGWFGFSVAGAGDADGDGRADVFVGAPFADAGGVTEAGEAYVLSSSDGSELFRFSGVDAKGAFGLSVASAGDVDADGRIDWIVGAPRAQGASGYALVLSGKDGSTLYRFAGGGQSFFGNSVAGIGDTNLDGFADVAVSAFAFSYGFVKVFSGKDGRRISRIDGVDGWKVRGCGDVDQDGSTDLWIGSPFDPTGGTAAGKVGLYSSRGVLLREYLGAPEERLGHSLGGPGDVDGDGVPDLLAGTSFPEREFVRLYSGRTGSALYDFQLIGRGQEFAYSIAGVGDLDGDGRNDLAIGTLYHEYSHGAVFVHSGNDLFQNALPRDPALGEVFTLRTSGGEPGKPTSMVVVEWAGQPTFLPVFGIGTFDAVGERRVQTSIPSGLGLAREEVVIRAYALDAQDRVVVSADERIFVRYRPPHQ